MKRRKAEAAQRWDRGRWVATEQRPRFRTGREQLTGRKVLHSRLCSAQVGHAPEPGSVCALALAAAEGWGKMGGLGGDGGRFTVFVEEREAKAGEWW